MLELIGEVASPKQLRLKYVREIAIFWQLEVPSKSEARQRCHILNGVPWARARPPPPQEAVRRDGKVRRCHELLQQVENLAVFKHWA